MMSQFLRHFHGKYMSPVNAKADKANDERLIECESTLPFITLRDLEIPESLTERSDLLRISGSIIEISDDIISIKCDSNEHYVTTDMVKWKSMKGDRVIVCAFEKYTDLGVSNAIDIVCVIPESFSKEYARVTEIRQDLVLFEDKIVYFKNSAEPSSFVLHREYECYAIDSDQVTGNKKFNRRFILLPQLCLETVERVNVTMMSDLPFKLAQGNSIFETRVKIVNKSNVEMTLVKLSLEPDDDNSVRICNFKDSNPFVMKEKSGKYDARLKVFPINVGKREYRLTAEMTTPSQEKITRCSNISIEVFKQQNIMAVSNLKPKHFVDIKCNNHYVPKELRTFDLSDIARVVEALNKSYPFLNDHKMTPETYLDRLKMGIYIEEMTLEKAFNAYTIKKARFENVTSDGVVESLRLRVKDVAEKRPSISVGDKVKAKDPYLNDPDQAIYKGIIQKVENDSILIIFVADFMTSHHGKEYHVEFEFSRSRIRFNHHALQTITLPNSLGYNFLLPDRNEVKTSAPNIFVTLNDGKLQILDKIYPWFDNRVNLYQKKAIVNALRGECRPLPFIIYGPPGTGKTMTVVELILQIFFLNPESRMIVATPSNSAAYLFTDTLVKYGKLNNPHDFVRLVSFNQVEKKMIPEHLEKYCATMDVSSDSGERRDESFYEPSGLRKGCTKSIISNYRIIISTLSCLGQLMQMKFPDSHFTHVIIDEAGQSIEAETLIPLSLLTKGSSQVILAGDPKQLGPMSVARCVQRLHLDSSLLERLLTHDSYYAQTFGPDKNEFDPRFVTKLKINYRSLPCILSIYNNLFYNNELQGDIKDDVSSESNLLSLLQEILWNKKKNMKCGVYFVNVANGKNKKVRDSCSWHNEEEANAILSFLYELNGLGISFKDIGVITPYSLQVKKLKNKATCLPDAGLKIGTVEEFQGQERQIILVSTVRSEEQHFVSDQKFNLGFLQCKKRMNVAVSRARSLLVVFGKGSILEKDESWKKLVDFTKNNGTFVDQNPVLN